MSDATPQPTGPTDPITIRYHFRFSDGRQKTFVAELDPKTLELRQSPRETYPEWTKLDHCKCPTCPLQASQTPRCPAATSLVDIVEYFNQSVSFEEVDVEVETKERRVAKHCSLQEGIGSLIGVFMPTSGCPIMAKFKPMARFHLPFATAPETFYRIFAMSLLAQYFSAKHGQTPDWTWKDLQELCGEILSVDQHFFQRLVPITSADASLNAIVRLHAQADALELIIDQGSLEDIEQLFQAYWNGQAPGQASPNSP